MPPSIVLMLFAKVKIDSSYFSATYCIAISTLIPSFSPLIAITSSLSTVRPALIDFT